MCHVQGSQCKTVPAGMGWHTRQHFFVDIIEKFGLIGRLSAEPEKHAGHAPEEEKMQVKAPEEAPGRTGYCDKGHDALFTDAPGRLKAAFYGLQSSDINAE